MNRLPIEIIENIVDELKTIYIVTRIGPFNTQFYGIYDILTVVSSKQKAIDVCKNHINCTYQIIEKKQKHQNDELQICFYIIPDKYNNLYFGIYKTTIL